MSDQDRYDEQCTLDCEKGAVIKVLKKAITSKTLSRDEEEAYRLSLSFIIGTSNCYCTECTEDSKKYFIPSLKTKLLQVIG